MEHCYDAHLYVANWGTHRVMFRLPCDLLDADVVEDYCVGDQVSARVTDEFVVLDFISEDHVGEFDFDYDAETWLSAIVEFEPNSPPVISGRSISPGWPPTSALGRLSVRRFCVVSLHSMSGRDGISGRSLFGAPARGRDLWELLRPCVPAWLPVG
ncbi:hypothetical protein Atai01_68770 [Amycolatopsis taiwanensis]|uniref:Uncharacterized protein n=1 Tax=Amycolatopsis taiwanensis TaxID=342230 RepID=A0A9W6R7K0_9PSEU|nr:hypothetical protein Atai01_68770 [Amycolatopsis taiwanensis]